MRKTRTATLVLANEYRRDSIGNCFPKKGKLGLISVTMKRKQEKFEGARKDGGSQMME